MYSTETSPPRHASQQQDDDFLSMLRSIEQKFVDLPKIVRIRIERWYVNQHVGGEIL